MVFFTKVFTGLTICFFALTLNAVEETAVPKNEEKTSAEYLISDGSAPISRNTIVKPDPENTDNKVVFYTEAPKGSPIYVRIDKNDFSKYKSLTFRMYSAEASGNKIVVVVTCKNPNKSGYLSSIIVDWKGWKNIVLPLDKFKTFNKPEGWNEIHSLSFNFKGWGANPNPTATYYFDDIRLIEDSAK